MNSNSSEKSPLLGGVKRLPLRRGFIASIAVAMALIVVVAVYTRTSGSSVFELVGDPMQKGFPRWAQNRAGVMFLDTEAEDNSLWRQDTQAPFIPHVNMYTGPGVDLEGSAENVRNILKISKTFRSTGWNGNNFLTDFSSSKVDFLYRTSDTCLIIPPLDIGQPLYLDGRPSMLLTEFLQHGHNSMIILGGFQNIDFINSNIATGAGGAYSLKSVVANGPYELQGTVVGTMWQKSPMTIPCPDGDQCVGVELSSLPPDAILLYAAPGVAQVFAIPVDKGAIIYVGYDFSGPLQDIPPAWVYILQMAKRYITEWKDGMHPIHALPDKKLQYPDAVSQPAVRSQ